MNNDSNTLGTVFQKVLPDDWKQVRSWVDGIATKKRIGETLLAVSTVAIWAAIFLGLGHALQNYTIVGF